MEEYKIHDSFAQVHNKITHIISSRGISTRTVSAGISSVATNVRLVSPASSKESYLFILSNKSLEDSRLWLFPPPLLIYPHPKAKAMATLPMATDMAVYGGDDHDVPDLGS